MNILYTILFTLGCILLGYLVGSIPTGIIIGKLHGIDIRDYGSHNAGGTNVGRTLGKKAGITTIILDIFKCYLPMLVVLLLISFTPISNVFPEYRYMKELIINLTGLAVLLGHTFPLYAQFRGGKAVACFAGFVLFFSPAAFAICAIYFFTVFAISHKISVCSILTVPFVFLVSLVPMILDFTVLPDQLSYNGGTYFGPLCMVHISYLTVIGMFLGAALVIIRHKANIKRIKNHEEPVTHFSNTIDLKNEEAK